MDVEFPGGSVTLYPIEVMENGKVRKISKRYSDVLHFHQTILKAAPCKALEGFNFPHKSMFNTTSSFTKERRRSGFEEYFELLLRLGDEYTPFIATFLKGEDFEEIGDPEEVFTLERPASLREWLAEFYLPVVLVAWVYTQILSLVGAIRKDDSAAACLAVVTSPFILTIALSLFAPSLAQ